MSSLTAALPVRRLRAPWPRFIGLLAVVMLLGVVGWRIGASMPASIPGLPATEAEIADKWGVRVTHIAVLADGGLIDFRFQVLDPEKAGPVMEVDTRPHLYVEKTGQEVSSLYHIMHNHGIPAGESHYLIYNNSNGAIKRGEAVSVVFGTMRLEHIIAK